MAPRNLPHTRRGIFNLSGFGKHRRLAHDDLAEAGAETAPADLRRRCLPLAARRAIRYGDGLIPQAPSAGSGSPKEFMPRLRQMAEEAGRDPQTLSVMLGVPRKTWIC